tara:strand:+ start:63 stop:281 length:219 start_codon:yes stop_codon:yes gene_type:complete
MVKFSLIIWVCSFLGQSVCTPPLTDSKLYNSWYECSRAAHQESVRLLSKIGYKEVNKGHVGTRYNCKVVEVY